MTRFISYTRPTLQDLESGCFIDEIETNRELSKMKKQRTMFQMRKQDKTSEKSLNKTEINDLPDKELKVMVLKILNQKQREL